MEEVSYLVELPCLEVPSYLEEAFSFLEVHPSYLGVAYPSKGLPFLVEASCLEEADLSLEDLDQALA